MLYLELGILPFREIIRQRRLNFLHYILTQDKDSLIFKVFEKQNQENHKKDWVSRVVMDLEELQLNVTFVEIQQTSKIKWKNTVKTYIEEKTFKQMESLKSMHTKVKHLKHSRLKMQDYFLPVKSHEKITKEEIQLIFQMRSKVTNLKMKNEKYECGACFLENESQEHIYDCTEIWKKHKFKNIEKPEYEQIMWGSASKKLKVARIFNENMKILEKIREKQ